MNIIFDWDKSTSILDILANNREKFVEKYNLHLINMGVSQYTFDYIKNFISIKYFALIKRKSRPKGCIGEIFGFDIYLTDIENNRIELSTNKLSYKIL